MKVLGKDSATWLEADEDVDGQRIDNLLVRLLKGVPRTHVYRLLRTGQVRVNSGRVDATYRIRTGDRIRIPPVRVASPATAHGPAPRRSLESAILHEDEHLLVIDKPAGMAVHGGSGVSRGIIEEMRLLRPRQRFLELVHRLDRDTSGVLLLAKKRAALVRLHEAIRSGRIHKHYTVLVKGQCRASGLAVSAALEKYLLPGGDRRVRVSAGGQPAQTRLTAIEPLPGFTLLDAELLTGRTHQIRVHVAHLGHPIAGDEKYGDFALNRQLAPAGLKRMFLHAARVEFAHPATLAPMCVESALPDDLRAFLNKLRAGGSRLTHRNEHAAPL